MIAGPPRSVGRAPRGRWFRAGQCRCVAPCPERSASAVGQDERMPRDSAPFWLRPIHQWFFWWEVVVPSIYRVVAVAVAATVSTALLVAAGVHPLVGAPVALVVCIGLAVVQEHDERVMLPVDPEFHQQLRKLVDPVLAERGFVFNGASGPCRARSDRTDVFLYERPDVSEGCIDLWIHRNREAGTMRVDFAGRGLTQWLSAAGEERLAGRIEQVLGPDDDDVRSLLDALSGVPEGFWD